MSFTDSFKVFMSKIWEFVLPLLQQFLKEGGLFALQMAFLYVPQIAMSMSDKDGASKRAEVFRLIMAAAKEKGISLSTSMVNAAIEAAVAKMKKE